MKVAIIGGGIGGLSAALQLLQVGLDVHVYEQAPHGMQDPTAGFDLNAGGWDSAGGSWDNPGADWGDGGGGDTFGGDDGGWA